MTSIRIPTAGKHLRERNRSVSFSPNIANNVHEKHTVRGTPSWSTKYFIPPSWPFSHRSKIRQSRIILPTPRRWVLFEVTIGRERPPWLRKLLVYFVLLAVFWNLYGFARRLGTPLPRLPFHKKPTTLVFTSDDLRRIWEWEVASGHYQSSRQIPAGVALESPLLNPGLPKQTLISTSRFKPPTSTLSTTTVGSGLKRTYLDLQSTSQAGGYPPRPVPGSIADLDIVLDHCDFSNNKYVRDCLEVLRVGAGLDNGRRVRRGKIDEWKYIYVEQGQRLPVTDPPNPGKPLTKSLGSKQRENLEPPLHLPPPRPYRTSSELATACDPDHPRIFHIFWGGPFTAHPHVMLLSFLFTQNLGLDHSPDSPPSNICRPQFWVWIQTGLAREAIPKPNALRDMFDSLKTNPWSAPFLHPRFRDIIKFKLWNTTEQLDSLHELKDEWRSFNLFNSGGHIYHVPKEDSSSPDQHISDSPRGGTLRAAKSKRHDDLLNRMGSASSSSYDRMRTILSDMARFVLCHRFGGIYLDADTIFLRDWEELWGWKGAFAYRWSRLPLYNTAVLKLNKGSALGTFLIRTALRQGLDFHPMTAISRYTKDANLDGLLLRLPDALFDSSWLNVEHFQRNRPPSPSIIDFQHFFATPANSAGEAQSSGFDGFFRGAYSYHWHNHWWMPFDPARNWPDLGPRFANSERIARLQTQPNPSAGAPPLQTFDREDRVEDDKRDLDWATVLKRTFESYIRGERPNMYGEWILWS